MHASTTELKIATKPELSRPIGVMDSGVGGLSVLQHIQTQLPHENLVYFADSRYAPYGDKTPKQIEARVFAVAKFLLTYGIKSLVIACNTATAATAQKLREKYAFLNLPIIAIEPAIKPAAKASRTGVIGVLATASTINSERLSQLIQTHAKDQQVILQACPGLVQQIEKGAIHTNKTHTLLQQYCASIINAGADSIVLGCTHYPFVKTVIQEIVGSNVQIIDSGKAVAMQLRNTLERHGLCHHNANPTVSAWTNSLDINSENVIKQLWGDDITVKRR